MGSPYTMRVAQPNKENLWKEQLLDLIDDMNLKSSDLQIRCSLCIEWLTLDKLFLVNVKNIQGRTAKLQHICGDCFKKNFPAEYDKRILERL